MASLFQRHGFRIATHLGIALMGFWIGRHVLPNGSGLEASSREQRTGTGGVSGVTDPHSGRSGPKPVGVRVKSSNASRDSDWEALLRTAQGGDSDEILNRLRTLHREPDLSRQILGRQLLIGRLAEIAPQRALAEAAALEGSQERSMAEVVVMARWASRDPVSASDYLAENSATFGRLDEHQRHIAGAVAAAWAGSDPGAAADWALDQPVESRGDALGAVIRTVAASDPERATEILNRLPEGFERTELVGSLVESLAESDPGAMAAWSLRLPGESERLVATAQSVRSWSNQDPESAAQWVSNLPEGPVRDAAIASLITGSSFLQSPETSAAWIEQIGDEDLRATAGQSLDFRWRTLDPETHPDFVDGSSQP